MRARASATSMRITFEDRGYAMRHRLSDRLERAASLRCAEHGQTVIAVDICARENGWFDARWTTCCEALERQAHAIVKDRC